MMDTFIIRKNNCEVSTSNEDEKEKNLKEHPNLSHKRKTKRQYMDEYMNYGFTWTGDKDCPTPLCCVCGLRLANSAMAPAKLKRHFTTRHESLSSKGKIYFERLLNMQNKQAKHFNAIVKLSDKTQLASYKIAELVAMKQKPHTIAESLILPACCEIVNIMFGENAKKEVMQIPLSNNTIQRRIIDMASDIESRVACIIHNTHFALQIDESTDISGKANLLAFIRFVKEDKIVNEFLCCRELIERTKGEDIFIAINSYFESWNLSWEHCVEICTDGAPSMVGSVKGFVAFAKQKNSKIYVNHCFLHREVLIVKTLPTDLKSVLTSVVNMVNYIKARPLKSRIFKQLCLAMEAKYEGLLLHTEIRWLSRGKVLSRVIELKKELLLFFENENMSFVEDLKDDLWCAKLGYLADIFNYVNSVNTTMQGSNENILTSTDKLSAFHKKIILWTKRVGENNLSMFSSMHTKSNDCISLILQHLLMLEVNVRKYFSSLDTEKYDWIRNPFHSKELSNYSEFTVSEEEELISLSFDRTLKIKHAKMSLDEFWISVQQEYPQISKKAINILLFFSTSYLCEIGFSTLTNIKTKKREKLLHLEEEMRVALSCIRPNIEEICKKNQAQVSH